MTEQRTGQLYREVIQVTEEYLGPAAERFIGRQVFAHFNKTPENLTSADLPKLIEWVRVTVSLLTNDHNLVDEYARKLEELHLAGK
jgi:hypothetical protein